LRDAILDYDEWYWQLNNVHKKLILPSLLAWGIEDHCCQENENKDKDKNGKTTYYLCMDTLELALASLPMF